MIGEAFGIAVARRKSIEAARPLVPMMSERTEPSRRFAACLSHV
jgi:hypothetical protein